MRFSEFKVLAEGFKEAKSEFTELAPQEEVSEYLEKFRDAVKRNRAQGEERNIDYWRKQGWEKFKRFVDDSAYAVSKRQLKRQKTKHGKSITLKETDKWLIVIPLDKEASCFHGKGTDWCTTKPFANYYEEYFYDNNVTLIYCLNKQTGGKWAIAHHNHVDETQLFDQQDNSIDNSTFKQQTGIDPENVIEMIDSSSQEKIQSQREEHNKVIIEIEKGLDNNEVSQRMESLLVKAKRIDLMTRYISTAKEETSDKLRTLYAKIVADGIKTQDLDQPGGLVLGYAADLISSSNAFDQQQRQLVNSSIVAKKEEIKQHLFSVVKKQESDSISIRYVLSSDLSHDSDMFVLATMANKSLGGIAQQELKQKIPGLPSDVIEQLSEKTPMLIIYNSKPRQITVSAFETLKEELLDGSIIDAETAKPVLAGFMEKILKEVQEAVFLYTDEKLEQVRNADIPDEDKEKIVDMIKTKQQERAEYVSVANEFVEKYDLEPGFNPRDKADELIGI